MSSRFFKRTAILGQSRPRKDKVKRQSHYEWELATLAIKVKLKAENEAKMG
jgi:hypothetical protein